MRRLGVVFFSVLLVLGCGGEEDDDPCGIAGTWAINYTIGGGTCLTEGATTTDTYTITLIGNAFTVQDGDGDQPDVGAVDAERCTMVLQYTDIIPETATTYEIRAASTEMLTFDEPEVSSTVSVQADLYEAGTQVGTCSQNITGTGTKQ